MVNLVLHWALTLPSLPRLASWSRYQSLSGSSPAISAQGMKRVR